MVGAKYDLGVLLWAGRGNNAEFVKAVFVVGKVQGEGALEEFLRIFHII